MGDQEPSTLSQKFDDIEMLEIPDDSISSETESLSDSSASGPLKDKPSKQDYIRLQDWLDSDDVIEFQFDPEQYKDSLTQNDVSKSYTKYINSLFKIIEGFTNDDITRIDLEDDEDPIGLISTSAKFGNSARKAQRMHKIDEAFTKIVENLTQYIHDIENIGVDEETTEQFYYLLSILDCLHANYFCSDTRMKPESIAKWINRFDYKPDKELVESVMVNSPKPYSHPQFWNTYLSQLITRGLLTQAIAAIEKSQYEELEENTPELFSVIQDFSMLLKNYTSMSMKHQFPEWKLSCCEFRDLFLKFKANISDSKDLIILNQIYDLLCILTGLPKTIAIHCYKWYEIYTALSLYQVRDDDKLFKDYFNVAISEKPPALIEGSDDLSIISEQCFVNILEEKFLKMLVSVDTIDSATAAYVARLLELKGLLNNYYSAINSKDLQELINRKTISEYLLTTHAYQCLNSHYLVPVGIGLLSNNDISSSSQSFINNRNTISEFLPHYECKTNDDLEWALTICAKLNLIHTARKLYQIYGKKSLKDGYLYESLNMFVNCYDPDSMTNESNEGMKQVHHIIWDIVFQDSLMNNRPIKDELINNIICHKVDSGFEVHPVIRQCLSPYAVLVEFFKSLEQSRSTTAMDNLSKLVHLIRFNHLPKKFYPLLLCQIIPFLIDSGMKFQLPDLIVIIELIDTFEFQATNDEYAEGENLYKYSISNIESTTESYDWRQILQQSGKTLPKDLKSLIKLLRNEVVAKIGKVYVDHM